VPMEYKNLRKNKEKLKNFNFGFSGPLSLIIRLGGPLSPIFFWFAIGFFKVTNRSLNL